MPAFNIAVINEAKISDSEVAAFVAAAEARAASACLPTDEILPLMKFLLKLVLFAACLCSKPGVLWSQSPPLPTTQCVSTAIAGGTSDALTVPLLPCSVTTTLLLLKTPLANVTTTPTLQPTSQPAQTIVRTDGTPLAAGELTAGATFLFQNTGTKWLKLTQTGQGGSGAFTVPSKDALALSASGVFPFGVFRTAYATSPSVPSVPAPPLLYLPQIGDCVTDGGRNDGGSCINGPDGNSWKAQFQTSQLDLRQFGCVADDATDCLAGAQLAITAANDINGCVYVPSLGVPFFFSATWNISKSSTCVHGDRINHDPLFGPSPTLWGTPTLHFKNDTDGITMAAGSGYDVQDLVIKGNAAESTVSTVTNCFADVGSIKGIVRNVVCEDFVVEFGLSGVQGRFENLWAWDKYYYPNPLNGFPRYAIFLGATGGFHAAAAQIVGGELAAQAEDTDTTYTADGVTAWYQACPQRTQKTPSTTGTQLGCSGAPFTPVDNLNAVTGLKVRVGAGTTLPNGLALDNGPLKTCGVDYFVYDVSQAGGAGSGGTLVYCGSKTISFTSGSTDAIVTACQGAGCALTTDIPAIPVSAPYQIKLAGLPGVPLGGIKPPTFVTAVNTSTNHLTLSTPALATQSVTLELTQVYVATSGPNSYSQTCQTTAGQTVTVASVPYTNYGSCGYHMEVRLAVAPAAATPVQIQWIDPSGEAAVYADSTSDYILLQPYEISGYRFGLFHAGNADGGIEFRPTYHEILDQLCSIEKTTYGDLVEAHRIINDPVPAICAVNSSAGPTVVKYNNVATYYNGASP